MKKKDLGIFNGDASDLKRLAENERKDFDADCKRLSREKRRRAELGIVADGKIFRGQRTADQRKTQTSKLNLAAKRLRSSFFNGGAELIHWNQERNGDQKN